MGLKAYLTDALGKAVGTWVNPLKVAVFGAGGGEYRSPSAFTATVSGHNKITLSGHPTITNASEFKCVRGYSADGRLVKEWYQSPKWPFVWDNDNSALFVAGAQFDGLGSVEVELAAEFRAYASAEDAYQSYSVNPEHAWTQQNDNAATGQTDGTTYYYYDMDGYKYAGWQILDTPGAAGDQTYTVEATWEDNGTAQASCDYTDVTNDWFGVASATTDVVFEMDLPITAKYVRIKVVRANDGANNDGAWDIHMRGTY